MTAISTPILGVASPVREDTRSVAKICIIVKRCSKEAGLAALSAFCVARRRTSRFGRGEGWESVNRADVAIRKWASVGGLKDESSI